MLEMELFASAVRSASRRGRTRKDRVGMVEPRIVA